MREDIISFGARSSTFFELSPYYFRSFDLGGNRYLSVLHYVWSNSVSPSKEDMMRGVNSATRLKTTALTIGLREGVSLYELMGKAVRKRFSEEYMGTLLLSTGGSTLFYKSSRDDEFAKDNFYGKLLMRVRDELQ